MYNAFSRYRVHWQIKSNLDLWYNSTITAHRNGYESSTCSIFRVHWIDKEKVMLIFGNIQQLQHKKMRMISYNRKNGQRKSFVDLGHWVAFSSTHI